MKKITLVIHPGYGKSGTTFLQENVFSNLKKYDILGKPLNKGNSLIKKQYKVFLAKYSVKNNSYPQNLNEDLKKYCDELSLIIKNSKKNYFLLSDECLFDGINYFGYINIFLLEEILKKLKNVFEVDLKFLLTIRVQYESLISYFAMDYHRQKKKFKNFEKFISKILNSDDLSNIYNYEKNVKIIEEKFTNNLLILPLEELELDPNKYQKSLGSFLGEEIFFSKNKTNKNSIIENNKKYFYLIDQDRESIYNFITKIYRIFKKIFNESTINKFKFLKNITSFKIIGKIHLDENVKKKIMDHYRKSNSELDETKKLGLKKYNYY